jgi:hypothetical protein
MKCALWWFLFLGVGRSAIDLHLPVIKEQKQRVQLGYQPISLGQPLAKSWRAYRVRDISFTALDVAIGIDERDHFVVTTELMYLKFINQWQLQ